MSEHAAGKSFPSGHVFSAMLLFGALAALIPLLPLPKRLRWPLQAACVAVALLMGLARVFVGAHWPSDVLGGWLWGGLIVSLAALAARRLSAGSDQHAHRASAASPRCGQC